MSYCRCCENGELDLFVGGVFGAPHEDLVQEYLFDDEFVVYASTNHRLARRENISLADIAPGAVGDV